MFCCLSLKRPAAILAASLLLLPNTHAVHAAEQLRPLTTDRPDLTESPFTVNAGHVQFESTLFGYSKSRPDDDGVTQHAYEFATTNMRIGLTNTSEVNIVWQPYGVIRRRTPTGIQRADDEGVGSLDVRAKINLFGNDTFDRVGDSALALLPFVSIPTDRGNGISVSDVEAGLIVPYAIVLPKNFGLGLNGGVFVRKDDDGDTTADVFLSAALSYEWTTRFGTYVEVAATLNTVNSKTNVALLATGFTFALDDNTQLDGGINVGVTTASDRIAPFIGLTRRF